MRKLPVLFLGCLLFLSKQLSAAMIPNATKPVKSSLANVAQSAIEDSNRLELRHFNEFSNRKIHRIGFFRRIGYSISARIRLVKKMAEEGRPHLKTGAFLLGLILGPLAFLFFIKNKDRDFRYSVKVGFAVEIFVLIGILVTLLFI